MVSFEAPGKEFQDYVYKSLKRKYPVRGGWEVFSQKQVRIMGIVCKADFLIENSKRKKRIIVEAKDKKTLSISDLRQLKEYKRGAKAQEAIFYVASYSHIPTTIKEAVGKSASIHIEKTRYGSSSLW